MRPSPFRSEAVIAPAPPIALPAKTDKKKPRAPLLIRTSATKLPNPKLGSTGPATAKSGTLSPLRSAAVRTDAELLRSMNEVNSVNGVPNRPSPFPKYTLTVASDDVTARSRLPSRSKSVDAREPENCPPTAGNAWKPPSHIRSYVNLTVPTGPIVQDATASRAHNGWLHCVRFLVYCVMATAPVCQITQPSTIARRSDSRVWYSFSRFGAVFRPIDIKVSPRVNAPTAFDRSLTFPECFHNA